MDLHQSQILHPHHSDRLLEGLLGSRNYSAPRHGLVEITMWSDYLMDFPWLAASHQQRCMVREHEEEETVIDTIGLSAEHRLTFAIAMFRLAMVAVK